MNINIAKLNVGTGQIVFRTQSVEWSEKIGKGTKTNVEINKRVGVDGNGFV